MTTDAKRFPRNLRASRPKSADVKCFHRRALLLATLGLVLVGSVGSADAMDEFKLAWQTNVLKITGDKLPGGTLDVWWLEAFCRRGSTNRPWNETTLAHTTE